jgi:hypothetical protein
MDPNVTMVGDPSRLRFSIDWTDDLGASTAAEKTRGKALVWVGERLVWGKRSGPRVESLEWTWIELLEHLAREWTHLMWEEGLPNGVDALDTYREQAATSLKELSKSQRPDEEGNLWAFEESHNLARALQGAWAAPLWLLREGVFFRVATVGFEIRIPADVLRADLSALGDAIASRLSECRDDRSLAAVGAWQRRDEAESTA